MTTIVTLTAIPPRFARLARTLNSLVEQDLPAPVELWIPHSYRRFPDWDGALPGVPEGVTIRRCAQDWGPATKLVPAVLERQAAGETDTDILFCDDDELYAPDWHRRFRDLRAARPHEALAAIGRHLPGSGRAGHPREGRSPRMRRLPFQITKSLLQSPLRWSEPVPIIAQSGYGDLLSGWGGVMVRPDFFAAELAQGPGEDWPVDDVWLSGMLELRGTPIWIEAGILPPIRRKVSLRRPLTGFTRDGMGRKDLDQACIDRLRARYGIWSTATLRLAE